MNRTVLPRRTVLLGGLAAWGATGCRRPEPGKDRPLLIVLGPQYAPTDVTLLQRRLAERTKLAIELRVAKSGDEAIDLVQSGEADAGLLPLFDFLFCQGVFKVEPLVQAVRGAEVSRASELLVRAEGGPKGLADLGGRKVGYVDKFSVSGYLLAAALLGEAKVSVQPVFLGSHDAVLEALASGKVDAGASYAGHAATQPGLTVLASTQPIAFEPVFVQSRVPQQTRTALRDALLAEKDAAAFAGMADITTFREAPPGVYQAALRRLESAGLHVEDTIRGGWQRANHHRRPAWSMDP